MWTPRSRSCTVGFLTEVIWLRNLWRPFTIEGSTHHEFVFSCDRVSSWEGRGVSSSPDSDTGKGVVFAEPLDCAVAPETQSVSQLSRPKFLDNARLIFKSAGVRWCVPCRKRRATGAEPLRLTALQPSGISSSNSDPVLLNSGSDAMWHKAGGFSSAKRTAVRTDTRGLFRKARFSEDVDCGFVSSMAVTVPPSSTTSWLPAALPILHLVRHGAAHAAPADEKSPTNINPGATGNPGRRWPA
mmetsp:Transcript_106582/g.306593  ORF Transcript_106582/g.306593 Transcript_106582/m.306593 type:complete len:242 (+) Transcript_106582:336-1061(+)